MPKKNQLRIIGGQWRGRKLDIADLPGLRPTGDRIRETLFNWLMADITGSHCLDLFCGSGALSLESLSRGAESVIMLEKQAPAIKQLKQHCQQLNAEGATIIQCDSIKWLNNNTLGKHSIDIAFIDPPFAENLWGATIEALNESQLLVKGALIYIETPKMWAPKSAVQWDLLKEKSSGDVCYRLYQTS